jgi:hypothetical protein
MKVLVACEYSGIVRDAFIAKGHDAISCDILPTESPGPHHQGDVLEIIDSDNWDLMIAHPPCTYLSVVGNRHFKDNPERHKKRLEAFDLFMLFMNAPIDKICCENPTGYINTHYRKPDQIIHPYYFGDPVMKRTCLWLKGLPKLIYTANSINGERMRKPDPVYIDKNGRPQHWCQSQIKNKNKSKIWKIRSKTFQGIADAMADQWG